jgi:signal transduction histidine kinase
MPKKIFCLLLLLWCLSVTAFCQTEERQKKTPLVKGLWFLPEGERTLPLTEVEEKWQQGRFDTLSTTTINFGRSQQRYWLRLQLADDVPKGLVMEISNAFLYGVELYGIDGLKDSLLYQTGAAYPFAQRPIPFRHFTLPLLNKKGGSNYYLLVDRRGELLRFSLKFHTTEQFQLYQVSDALFFGSIFGILLFIALFNTVLWAVLKDPIHIWYLAYIFFIFLFIAADNGFGYQWLWSHLPLVQKYIRNFLSMSAFIVQLRFMQLFLGQTAANSRYYFWTKSVTVGSLILMPLLVLGCWLDAYQVSIPIVIVGFLQLLFYGSFLSGVALIVLSSYERLKQRQLMAWVYLLAMLPLMAQVLLVMLSRWHLLTVDIDTALLFAVAVLLEVVTLGMGLVLRYNGLRKEKAALSIRLAQQQHTSIKKVMEAQEAERQRIAQDLHDHLGGTLSSVRGMLSGMPVNGNATLGVKLEQAQSILAGACDDLRNIAHDLMPAGFEHLTLAEALEESVVKANNNGGIRFAFLTHGEPQEPEKEISLALIRIANELIHNVVRHSGATEATLQLLWHPDMTELMMEDNGHGFDLSALADGPTGIGIKSIFSRAEYINAQIRYDTSARGTTVICTIP